VNGQVAPYARATVKPGTVVCEIISHAVVNAQQWRLSVDGLSGDGWTVPNPENAHWHRAGVPRREATAQILNTHVLPRPRGSGRLELDHRTPP